MGSWQGSCIINDDRAVRTLTPSSEEKKALIEFLQSQNLLLNLPTGFLASPNRCRCTAAFSSIQPTVLVSKQIRKTCQRQKVKKKKLHTCSCSGPGISEKTKETKII